MTRMIKRYPESKKRQPIAIQVLTGEIGIDWLNKLFKKN